MSSSSVLRALVLVSGLMILPLRTVSAAPPEAYRNSALPVDTRVADLLGRMTMDEKVALLSGKDGGETKDFPRLGIPSLRVSDGPHGVGWGEKATCFPSGISMGASWNPEIMREVGVALGQEARAANRQVLLGPCINIHRTPLGGRNFESMGEDPYLSGRIAVAYVQGIQSQKVGTSVKHYACNNQEWYRTTISVEISERALQEIYLPAFCAVVQEADPWTIMAAYNKVRGKWCAENPHLLNDILKKDWGFKGVVVSDWGATHSTVDSANAGLDLEMPGPGEYFNNSLIDDVKAGKVSQATIDDKVRRILRVIFLAGLMDPPNPKFKAEMNSDAHHVLARRLAEEAIVLLKNKGGVLPLKKDAIKSIAVIGPGANVARLGGGGSSTVEPSYSISPLDGLRKKCGDKIVVNYQQGCNAPADLTAIPSEYLTPAGATNGEHGLKGEYFDNQDLRGATVMTRIDPQVSFSWGGGSPDSRIPCDHFSVRWTGKLTPAKTAKYQLGMTTDDGFRLFLDGKLVVDNWVDQSEMSRTAMVELEGGRSYDIRAEYYENVGAASAKLGWLEPDEGSLKQAVAAARSSDVAILVVGLSFQSEGEGCDRVNMDLPGRQAELIEAVAAANSNTIVVLNNGTPLVMTPWLDKVAAVVEAWYPGIEGGNAIANVLFGDVNPSGKLPVTFPKKLEDSPSFGNYPGANGVVKYVEGIFVGYRYYDTKNVEPLFPFGYGLSYTKFEYSNLKISPAADAAGKVVVKLDVKNVGDRAGAEVVELYVHDVESSVERPAKELKAFKKVQLAPGEKQTVSLTLDKRAFSFYDDKQHGWRLDPGKFEILVGSSSRDIRIKGSLTL